MPDRHDGEVPERVELRPPPELTQQLLEDAYPAGEYPEIETVQDAFVRAAADIIRCRRDREQAVADD